MTQVRPTLPSGAVPPPGTGGTGFVPPTLGEKTLNFNTLVLLKIGFRRFFYVKINLKQNSTYLKEDLNDLYMYFLLCFK